MTKAQKRIAHRLYMREYIKHPQVLEQRREYMRGYMRKYNKRRLG